MKLEPLKELNKIVQKPDYKIKGNWMARHITRDMALPLTWLFLHLPITANGVTFIGFMLGIAGCVLFALAGSVYIFAGAIFLQLWYLFDHIDGQIARYKREASVTGIFFDYITHHVIHMGIFFSIGWGVYMSTSNNLFILSGILVALNIMILNLIYDCQYKAFFHAMTKNFISTGGAEETKGLLLSKSSRDSKTRHIFSFIHKLCEIHVVMNIITGFAVAGLLFKDFYAWDKFMIFYLAISTITAISKAAYFVVRKIPDNEYGAFVFKIWKT